MSQATINAAAQAVAERMGIAPVPSSEATPPPIPPPPAAVPTTPTAIKPANLKDVGKRAAAKLMAEKPVVTPPVVEPVVEPIAPEITAPTITDNAPVVEPVVVATPPPVTDANEPKLTDEQRSTLQWLNDDEPATTEAHTPTATPEQRDVAKELETYKTRASELEALVKDPLVEALIEFRKTGSDDLAEFVKQAGVLDTASLSMEDMYRMKATELGFAGEDLDQAVLEDMERYDGLTKTQRKEEELQLKSKYKSNSNEKLKSLTEKLSNERQKVQEHFDAVGKKAETDLKDVVSKLKGTNWKGLLIDDAMASEIEKMVPKLSPVIAEFDENQNLKAYNVKEGVEFAIYKLYSKQLLKSTYNLGRAAMAEEVWKDRTRTTPNNTAAEAPVVNSATLEDSITEARKGAANKASGKKTLFSLSK